MGLSEDFGSINRTQLWTTLYMKGLPLETITLIRKGNQSAAICTKLQGKYGGEVVNDAGAIRVSAISALLFIIYLYYTMGDYRAVNRKAEISIRTTLQWNQTKTQKKLLGYISKHATR